MLWYPRQHRSFTTWFDELRNVVNYLDCRNTRKISLPAKIKLTKLILSAIYLHSVPTTNIRIFCLFAGRASAAPLIALGEPQLKIKTPPLSS
jgi:hypothetical protein